MLWQAPARPYPQAQEFCTECGRLLAALLAACFVTALSAQTLQVNELQPANNHTLLDEEGDSSDWIELWNPGPEPFELKGCGLSDDGGEPFQWAFRSNRIVAPGEFLVVFASGKDREPTLPPSLPPDDLVGLKVWLRADAVDPSNPGQTRVVAGHIYLRRWLDQSGSCNHAEQPWDDLQPRWLALGPDGLAYVRFDGADDLLRLARPVGTNAFCLFVVCRTPQPHESDPQTSSGVGGVQGQRWLFGARYGGDLDAGAGVSIGTNGISVYEHGSGYMPALAAYQRPIGTGLQVVAVNYASRQPSLDSQGLIVRTGLVSPRRQVWAPVEIGAGAYGAFGGDLLEVIMFNRSLSANERRGIARYLADRYGLPLPLPCHTNFRLSTEGEEVVLTRSDGTILDRVTFGPIPRDVSYGRSMHAPSQWHFFAIPTPGTANTTEGSTDWLLPPSLSAEGGFYSHAFDLTLSSPDLNAQIRYTLDGSEPNAGSPLYVNPVPIISRAGTPNDLSAIPTVPGGSRPVGEVFKGWPVRARAFRSGALPSAVVTRTYWVHPRGSARYSLPVVALTTDRGHFFDPDRGIYVPGNTPGGNYSQRGPEWERPVHIEFYESDGRLAFAQNGDVKIHGNTSQNFPIKGLDLDGTGGGGDQPFRYPVFPRRSRSEFEHLLLRPSGHDQGMAFMRDELMQELAAEIGMEAQAARPCVVFLNGEYWGLHYLKEKEDAEFVSHYGAVPMDSFDYLEGYAAAKVGDTLHYDAMIQFIAANNPALPGPYQQIQALMEIPNYIDYKVCEVFNYRWDIGNHRLWRPKTPDGRWRWLQFDNDVGWGGFWATQPAWSYDMLTAVLTADGRLHGHNNDVTTFLLRRLVLNPTFRQDFINRFADLLNTILLPANTLAHIDHLAAQLAPEMAEHCRRWSTPASLADWQRAVNDLRDFARRRPDFCRQHLANTFNLRGSAELSVAVDPPGTGTLRLNSLNLMLPANEPWRGTYFQGHPIRLVALPHAGYRFAHWVGLPGVTTNDVTLLLQGDWSLTARLTPISGRSPQLQAHLARPTTLCLSLTAASNTRWALEASPDLRAWSTVEVMDVGATGRATTTVDVELEARQFFRAHLR